MPRLVRDGSLEVGGRTVKVSSVGKPFFPDAGLNKGDLLAYYRDVAEVMLPYLAGRPLNLQRFPNGVDGHGFWQQGASDHFPDWVRTVTVERRGRGGTVDHVVCEDAATIVYLANLATVTFHAWTSTIEHLARPDLVILDLDPTPTRAWRWSGPRPGRSGRPARSSAWPPSSRPPCRRATTWSRRSGPAPTS